MDPKTRAILMVARRGSVPDVPIPHLMAAIGSLGWTVEEVKAPVLVDPRALSQVYEPDAKEAEAIYQGLKEREAPPDPTADLGTVFVTDVKKPKAQVWLTGGSGYNIFYKLWRIVPGVRIIDSCGGTFLALPDGYDVSPGNWQPGWAVRYRLGPLAKWLKGNESWKCDAQQALGEGEYIPTTQVVPQSQYGSGTCPVCFGLYKLRPGGSTGLQVVLHGYERPGYGFIMGQCPGVGCPPFEHSASCTQTFRDRVTRWMEAKRKDIEDLLSGRKVPVFHPWNSRTGKYDSDVTLPSTSSEWKQQFQRLLRSWEGEVRGLEENHAFLTRQIDQWVPRPIVPPGGGRPVWE